MTIRIGAVMTSDDSVSAAPAHIPVMLEEALAGLNLRNDGTYLDGTFGRGGHARALLARLGPDARLLLMDRDPAAVAVARAEFGADPRVAIRHGSFADLMEWTRRVTAGRRWTRRIVAATR
jgi:16S rRNA (cytosine1402-N4)-methyltransferase